MLDWLELLCQPVALIAWGLLYLVWRSWRDDATAAARRVATLVTIVYFVVATPLGANLPVGLLEAAEPPASGSCQSPPPGSAIVVLAGGMSGEPVSPADVARLRLETLRRVIEGLRLARAKLDARVVLAGGGGGVVREADLMASLATDLGFPPARLVLERESRTTAEAAANVARLLGRDGARLPAVHLVTSAMHMPRAAASFRHAGVDVCPVPVDRRWVRPEAYWALVPQISALEKSTAAIHEIIGYAVYRITGRL